MSEGERYLVGDLTVDPGRGRVMRATVEVPLPRLPYDLDLLRLGTVRRCGTRAPRASR